jgi:hypothetical protein
MRPGRRRLRISASLAAAGDEIVLSDTLHCGSAIDPTQQLKKANNKINWKRLLIVFGGLIVLSVTLQQFSPKTSKTSDSKPETPKEHWNSLDGKIEALVKSETHQASIESTSNG